MRSLEEMRAEFKTAEENKDYDKTRAIYFEIGDYFFEMSKGRLSHEKIPQAKEERRTMPYYVDYLDYLINEHGFEKCFLTGRIGTGDKIHIFFCCVKLDSNNKLLIAHAFSGCGSQRWSLNYRSPLYIIKGTCTCKKCGA